MTDDVCNCYDNWGIGIHQDSGDCSERKCPYELAWVDTPDKVGAFHKYAECSGRGICERGTGECACFDGYEGKGCQRTTCPNDCSGHGTCEYIDDMSFGATYNDYENKYFHSDAKTFDFQSWDAGKTRGCVCDAQYGDVDCSKRMCPYGNDILDIADILLTSQKYQRQELRFVSQDFDVGVGAGNGIKSLQGQTFALTFTSRLNETFTTIPIAFDETDLDDFVNDIQLALLNLPNRVIDGVTVKAYRELTALKVDGYTALTSSEVAESAAAADGNLATNGAIDNADNAHSLYGTTGTTLNNMVRVVVEFTGDAVQGPQHLLTVEDYECSDGCTPKMTVLLLEYRYDHTTNNVTESQLSDFNSYECGRRGKCDYDAGLCECFTGYSGDNCNTLTTLV